MQGGNRARLELISQKPIRTTLIDTYCYCWVDFLSYVFVVIDTFIRLRHIFSPSLQLSFFLENTVPHLMI